MGRKPGGDSPLARFERSMQMSYEKWHDGIGYDLDALRAASPDERAAIEEVLLRQSPLTWNDVEALAALGTPDARARLCAALTGGDTKVRAAVMHFAPHLADDDGRTAALVQGLESGVFYGGLTQTLALVEAWHPPAVVDALLRGALHREGDVAVHFAAMLMYVHDQAEEPFDWAQRPFFLRFNTADRGERVAAFRELCARIGADAQRYLG